MDDLCHRKRRCGDRIIPTPQRLVARLVHQIVLHGVLDQFRRIDKAHFLHDMGFVGADRFYAQIQPVGYFGDTEAASFSATDGFMYKPPAATLRMACSSCDSALSLHR